MFDYEDSARYYEARKAEFEQRYGELTEAAQGVLVRAAQMEHMANLAYESIDDKGLREHYWISNSRSNTRENKDLGQFLKICGQQTKLLAALKLLPVGRATAKDTDIDEDEVDELQDI